MNTILATLVAGFVGILASSLAQLDSTTLTLQVVPALGAVLFARFTSFAITCVAGLAIGVVQSLIYYFSTQSWFPTDQGAALPGRDRAGDVRHHRHRAVVARLEPADAR